MYRLFVCWVLGGGLRLSHPFEGLSMDELSEVKGILKIENPSSTSMDVVLGMVDVSIQRPIVATAADTDEEPADVASEALEAAHQATMAGGLEKVRIIVSTPEGGGRRLEGLDNPSIKRQIPILDDVVIVEFSPEVTKADIEETVRKAKELGSRVEADVFIPYTHAVPNDPYFTSQWAVDYISARDMWKWAETGRPILIGVIDSGIDYRHVDLAANIHVNQAELLGRAGEDDDGNSFVDDIYGYNFFDDTSDPMDTSGHGTHVAGIIGAIADNYVGVVGINPYVKMVACKWMDSQGGYTSDAAQCIDYCRIVGCHVTSNSYGGSGYSRTLLDAIVKSADQLGTAFITSSGNEAQDLDIHPSYPACFSHPSILTVASITSSGAFSSWSNHGPSCVDVAAPGQSILSTYLFSSYKVMSGTSMACPAVAGVVGAMMSVNNELSGIEAVTLLRENVQEDPNLKNFVYSSGVVNARSSIYAAMYHESWLRPEHPHQTYRIGAYGSLEVPYVAHPSGTGIFTSEFKAFGLVEGVTKATGSSSVSIESIDYGGTVIMDQHMLQDGLIFGTLVDTPSTSMKVVISNGGPGDIRATADVPEGFQVSPGETRLLESGERIEYKVSCLGLHTGTIEGELKIKTEGESISLPLHCEVMNISVSSSMSSSGLVSTLKFTPESECRSTLKFSPVLSSGVIHSYKTSESAEGWVDVPDKNYILQNTDDAIYGIPLSFEFPYFNKTSTSVFVSSNGMIFLSATDYPEFNENLEGDVISVFGADLVLTPESSIWYRATYHGLVVSWENLELFEEKESVISFQAFILRDGSIVLHHRDDTSDYKPIFGLYNDGVEKYNLPIKTGVTTTFTPTEKNPHAVIIPQYYVASFDDVFTNRITSKTGTWSDIEVNGLVLCGSSHRSISCRIPAL